MMRPLAWVVAATLFVGCQTPTALVDPFLGRQTVPPRSTGMATNAPPDSSYYNAPKTPSASISNSGANSPYAPQGGFQLDRGAVGNQPQDRGVAPSTTPASQRFNGSSVPIRPTNPSESRTQAGNSNARTSQGSFQVNNSAPVRVVEPTRTVSTRGTGQTPLARAPASSSSTTAPRRTSNGIGTQRPADIMSLPEVRPGSPRTSPNTNSSGGFRPTGSVKRASYEEPVDVEAEGTASRSSRAGSVAPTNTKYNYDRDYRRLSGKLEYSRADDRWKLRYIPIDGETDEYGGSVVLLGSKLLSDYKPGEFVTITGRIEDTGGDGGFAPSYRVDRVE